MDVVSNWERDRCVITTLMDHICTAIHFAMDIDKGATLERIKHNEPILDIYFPLDYFEYPNRASGYKVFIKRGFHIVIYNQSIVITRINQDTEEKCVTIPVNCAHQCYNRTLRDDLHRFFEHEITCEVFTKNGNLSNSDIELLISLCGNYMYLEHLLLLFTFIADNESMRLSVLKTLLSIIQNDWEQRPEEKMTEIIDPLDAIISKAKTAYPESFTEALPKEQSEKCMKYCDAYECIFNSLNDIAIAFFECGLTDYDTFVEHIDKELMEEDLKYLDLKPSYFKDERPVDFLEECLKHYKE